jgi:hypothetical protein
MVGGAWEDSRSGAYSRTEQVRGEGVAQNVWAERLADAELLAQLLAGDTNSIRRFLQPHRRTGI